LNEIIVEIDGNVDAFIARISAAGLSVARRDSELAIEYRSEGAFDSIPDAAADLEIAIRSLHVNARSLEEVYLQHVVTRVKAEDADVALS
jgi:hypothetical protein